MQDVRRTRAWRRLVDWAKRNLPWVCHLCDQRIPRHVSRFHPLAYELDHVLTVRDYPALALSPANVKPSHRQCNAYRKARPLTPGLKLEITERFAARPPAALGFFDSSSPTLDNQRGGRVETPEPEGGLATVIPSGFSPRSLSVTRGGLQSEGGAAVTHYSDGPIS